MKTRAGFTLIELLTVIAILGILASILFPVFSRARENARRASCQSNLKQIGLGVMQYVQDHDGNYPFASNYGVASEDPQRLWTALVHPYIRSDQVYLCPSETRAAATYSWATRGELGYGYNSRFGYDPAGIEAPKSGLHEAILSDVVTTIVLAETPCGPTAQKYRGYTFDPQNGSQNAGGTAFNPPLLADRDLVAGSPLSPGQLKPVYCRHFADGTGNGSSNLLFADGHVKSLTARALSSAASRLVWQPQ
jgi:prepilin-type N-terminal cleavage/methylation domain-containing protein/prepilin-type processing-associated H-X9-DG protein